MRRARAHESSLAHLARLARRWWPDRNPLRRTADRVETVVLLVLLAAFLAGAPLAAVTAGHWAAAGGLRTERLQADWRQVPATLLRNAPERAKATFGAALDPRVPARWTAPGGAERTGRIAVPDGARAGSKVEIWTDGSGRPTAAPLRTSGLIGQVAVAAFAATVIVALVLTGAWLLARWLIDRRRLAAWDARWSATGPQWTGRR